MKREQEELIDAKPVAWKRLICLFIGHRFKRGMCRKWYTQFNICSTCKNDVPFFPNLKGYVMNSNTGEWIKKWRIKDC